MDIKQLLTMITLSQTLNYQKAAEQLQYAPSTLFKHIQMLEQEVGAPLFCKTGRQLALTRQGEAFLVHANRMVEHYYLALDSVCPAEKLEGTDVFPVSARKGRNVRALKEFLVNLLPEGGKVFEEEIVSDRSEKFMIAEIMREKILLKFDQEIPHGIAVVINTFTRNENGVYDINLDIVCEKQAHKAILIGKQGRAIKEVSSFARQDMEKFLQSKVFLTTYVKVKEDWRDRPNLMKEFGYEKPQTP